MPYGDEQDAVERPGETAAWEERFSLRYREEARASDEARRRVRRRARSEPTTERQRAFVERKREEAVSRRRCIEIRLTRGHVHPITLVGGNPAYRREAGMHRGLVSDGQPLLQLFVSKLPRARWTKDPGRRLKSGRTKSVVEDADSKLLALDEAYVEANKKCCGILRVEIDQAISIHQIAAACRSASVPAPNLVVGWVDDCGRYWNPHLLWLLENSVPMTGERGVRFKRLYFGVLNGLTKAMLPLGADPNGLLNAYRHKNAVCPLWDRAVIAPAPWSLDVLKRHVDITCTREQLNVQAEALGLLGDRRADHPDARVGGQSNRLFQDLTRLARQEVGGFRSSGRDDVAFAAWLEEEAYRLAVTLVGSPAEHDSRVRRTAASVAKWTWDNWRDRVKPAMLTRLQRAEAHANGGRKAAAVRKARTVMEIVAAVGGLPEATRRLGLDAVIKALVVAKVRGRSTLYCHQAVICDAIAVRAPKQDGAGP